MGSDSATKPEAKSETADKPSAGSGTAKTAGKKTKLNIGLALSGGGFRATLFHLGLIRFLRDAGLLTSITHLASVSGGSVMAAHLIYRWGEYTSDDDATFEKAAAELIAFTQQDVRGKIVRRLPLLVLAGLIPKVKLGRTDLLEQFYDRFYGYTTLHELRSRNPTAPALHILTTNFSAGSFARSRRTGFASTRRREARRSRPTPSAPPWR